jgi:hypothetical protein
MPKSSSRPPIIAELFRIPTRFLRSVQLERDFHDVASLEHYIITPSMAEAFRSIAYGLRANSGRRAWRITGDYGVGKSSFALVLAHLLHDPSSMVVSRIAEAIGWPAADADTPLLLPVLVTGAREGIVPALARGIVEALRQGSTVRDRKASHALVKEAERIESEVDAIGLERLIEKVRTYANTRNGRGVLLIIDELGKLLEYASLRPDREDVFILQRLAEMAARSGERRFALVGLLHQGFHAYAERLPSAVRHEWNKVAGRFDEIVFDQPLAHAAALVSGALNLDIRRLPLDVQQAARSAAHATAATGWLGGATTDAATLDAAKLYPLHPTALPVLVRFFALFGQHERSLFGFLLSSEPFGLQTFSARSATSDSWYSLAEFYDYIRAVFGHRLAGASYRNHWLRIVSTIDCATDLNRVEERAIKVVAVLNLLDAEDLLATDRAVAAAIAPAPRSDIEAALQSLLNRGLLFKRGNAGGYRLWPNSSVSLEGAFHTAIQAIGTSEGVSVNLEPFLDREPVLARRHYVERGTLRYFEVRYARIVALADIADKSTDADGLIVVALADTEAERLEALQIAVAPPFSTRPDVLIAVIQPLFTLASELQDLRCWQWVANNTPELAHDAYAGAEVARQLAMARRALNARIAILLGLRRGTAAEVSWFRGGKPAIPRLRGGLSALLSDICDQLYPDAPRITNELLNRNTLSSAAAAARMRLIEGLFTAADLPLLGIDPAKAPPEKSMYLSVLDKGHVHIFAGDHYEVVEPSPSEDRLGLRPALTQIVRIVESARGERVCVANLLSSLKEPPWGVRSGVAPLLLAIVLRTRAHELAVFERGTFLHRFGPSDFLRLTKAPAAFEIQHCKVEGVRLEVFNLLAAVFATGIAHRRPKLLDVVTPLCQFAAQLPEYTRKSTALGVPAQRVRDALFSAREPASLLFQALPEACGFGSFHPDQAVESERIQRFVGMLQVAVDELRAAYQQLLGRIVELVAEAIGENARSLDRGRLAARASRVSLAAREPRLRTFALRLRDPGLTEDAWAEALGSFVIAKPPARWSPGDEARFCEETTALAEVFRRVEALVFETQSDVYSSVAMRLNLTRGDGHEVMSVIETRADEETTVQVVLNSVQKMLPQNRRLRLDVLARLLWTELAVEGQSEAGEQRDSDFKPKRVT